MLGTYGNYNNNNGKAFNGNAGNFETVQKARQDLIGEIGAIIEYDDHIHTTNNEVAKQTWTNIKGEELTHVGELLALLDYLDPEQKNFVTDGIAEFNARLGRH
jgi:hypothetical protein